MKLVLCILAFLIVFGCKPENNNDIIVDKFVEGFIRTKYTIANHRNAKSDELLLPLIDSIIEQTNSNKIKGELRQKITAEIENIPKPKVENERERYTNLKISSIKFIDGRNSFLEDLKFIDLFLEEKYWQHWSCNMGVHRTETLLSFDTVLLKANTEYELPIRIEYNGLPSSVSVISNSIEGSRPNTIKFRTQNKSNKYQTVNYECEAINKATGESMKFKDKIIVQLIGND